MMHVYVVVLDMIRVLLLLLYVEVEASFWDWIEETPVSQII